MKNKIKNISKTILTSLVIFQMVFATAAMPVVAFAFEEEIQAAQEEVASEPKEEVSEESKVEVSETTDETETVKDETSTEDSTATDEPATPEDTTTADESSGSNGGDNEGLVAGVSSPERLAVVDATGVITVCKLIVDADGNIVNGSEFPNETFTIPFDDASVVFDTDTFIPNTVFGATDRFNAECRRHEGLPFGIYNYGAEITSGPTEWKVTYTEGDIASIDGGYSYGAESLSDGVIDLGGQNLLTDVTLYVINQEEASSCPEGVISARINFSKVSNGAQVDGWRNWGTGDFAPKVYVGGNTPAHQYDDGEWFPLTNPDGSYINDTDIEDYSDVEGLAVQRMEGKVRVVLYGFHDIVRPIPTKGGPVGASQEKGDGGPVEYAIDGAEGKEFASFGLVLSHAGFGSENSMISPLSWSNDNSNPRIHDPMINDAANPMDSRGTNNDYINQYNPRFDRMRTYDAFRVHSVLVVTTGSDGFYASYDIDPNSEEDCNSGEDDPQINLPSIGCIETSVLYFDYLAGVTVTDDEGAGNVTLTYDASGIMLGTPGDYVVTYTAVDSDGNIDEEIRTIHIEEDCGNSGSAAPKLTIPGPLCIETDLMTFDFMAGVSATDDEGPSNVTITNDSEFSVDLGTNGVYTVTYKATDSDGNQVEKTRIVYIKENCGNGPVGELPVITIGGQSCIETSAVSFDFAAGVTATDAEDGNITGNINYDSSAVIFGTAGTYVVTYDITDSDGNVTIKTRNFTVSEDCSTGGNGNFPVIVVGGNSCMTTEATSYNFMGSVGASDVEDGMVSVTVDSSAVVYGVVGTYKVIYSATDSDGNTTTLEKNFTISNDCPGTGGGSDQDPTITTPGQACVLTGATSFDFMNGVSANDAEDGDLTSSIVLDGEETVIFGTNGTYTVSYSVTDSLAQPTTITRTIVIAENCDDNGGGNGGGGNGGGGSSSGSSRRGAGGEVLGADIGPSCIRFTEYHDTGDTGGEIRALQVFLNEYMDAGLTVDGVYSVATTQAVHDFQAMHWDDIIDPWTPPLSPNTTGREYKTTRATINAIMDCPEVAVYLEDPGTMFEITEVKSQKTFTEDQIAKVVAELAN